MNVPRVIQVATALGVKKGLSLEPPMQGFSQDFETVSHFCGHIFFLIMNKQEYNELNIIISYVALLVSNGD